MILLLQPLNLPRPQMSQILVQFPHRQSPTENVANGYAESITYSFPEIPLNDMAYETTSLLALTSIANLLGGEALYVPCIHGFNYNRREDLSSTCLSGHQHTFPDISCMPNRLDDREFG